jgi:hypothetical protein
MQYQNKCNLQFSVYKEQCYQNQTEKIDNLSILYTMLLAIEKWKAISDKHLTFFVIILGLPLREL